MEKKKLHKTQHKRHSCTYLQSCIFFIWKLKVYLFNILLGCVYKKIPEATYTYIYCTSVKDYLLNLLGNVEVADLIAPDVTQLTTLLSEPACRLIKPIEIDYNFIEVEHQYLFDIVLQGNALPNHVDHSRDHREHLFLMNIVNLKIQIQHHL